jgi:NADH-quinone oxidoreductase subunit E
MTSTTHLGKITDSSLAEILKKHPRGDRAFLIPILQDVLHAYGYVSPEAVHAISAFTGVTPGDIFGVASFYPRFRFNKPGKHKVNVCSGTACHVRGSDRILENIERQLKIKPGGTTVDNLFSLDRIACFGCCALAPVVVVDDNVHARMNLAKAQKLLNRYERTT